MLIYRLLTLMVAHVFADLSQEKANPDAGGQLIQAGDGHRYQSGFKARNRQIIAKLYYVETAIFRAACTFPGVGPLQTFPVILYSSKKP
ncbi:hypothetical protein MPL1032_40056 [Mesorhizobium plurifarium]|uniref:Uncharacterized protein n=1 Tax=Mesorhizobium plurifarium TaxID=69974 RepID=A0A0K2W5E3_MESPL|nr:hypothetical protein MPL1032_40056 [Mesorhizobium plurifarium]